MAYNKSSSGPEYLAKLLDIQGIATASVSDGRLVLFKRAKMQEILDKNPDADVLSILIKTPDFKN